MAYGEGSGRGWKFLTNGMLHPSSKSRLEDWLVSDRDPLGANYFYVVREEGHLYMVWEGDWKITGREGSFNGSLLECKKIKG